MRKATLPKLSIKYILSQLSPEDIFSKYWSIPAYEILESLENGQAIQAPYREDNNPSLGFYEKDGKLYARDFGGYFWGDCFDAAAFALNKNRYGKDFGELLNQIAKDFAIHKYSTLHNSSYNITIQKSYVKKQRMKFDVRRRDWNIHDKMIWYDKYCMNSDFLESRYIYPVNSYFINGLLRYTYDYRNPAYAYYFGQDENDIPLWKLYFPLASKERGEQKFIQNCSALEGELFIRPANIGVVTKSYKDTCAIDNLSNRHSLSILAINTSSESTILTPTQYDKIMKNVPILYTLSDYDKTGIRFAFQMRRKYGTIPLFFTRGRFNKFDFLNKDFTDNLEYWGEENIVKLMKIISHQGHEVLLKQISK